MLHRDRQSRIYLHGAEKPSPRSSATISRSESPSSIGSYSDLALTLDSRDSKQVIQVFFRVMLTFLQNRYAQNQTQKLVVLGVCAMDIKARNKAMTEILTRLVERARGMIEVKVFGDKVILDEGEF
jgi:inositol hexakisphosphate/diphosphoinositol-pentakisphosphate kinase